MLIILKKIHIKLLLTVKILIYITFSFAVGQSSHLASTSTNLPILFEGIDNYVKILIEGKEFVDLSAKYNGKELQKSNGFFLINPSYEHDIFENFPFAEIYIDGYDSVILFEIHSLPPPEINLYPYLIGSNPKNLLYLEAFYKNLNIYTNFRFEIKEFTFKIKRNNNVIFKKTILGFEFDDESKNASKKLKSGDIILIEDVEVIVNDTKHFYINKQFPIYNHH